MGYSPWEIRVPRETQDPAHDNQVFCWNPLAASTKTEDGFIATKDSPITITSPVICPRIEYRSTASRSSDRD